MFPTSVFSGVHAGRSSGSSQDITYVDYLVLVSELQAVENYLLGLSDNTTASVKDFGAVGDGVTDDTDALNAALAEGGNIYFPPGIYLISNEINVTQDFTNIYGPGATLRAANANNDIFRLSADYVRFNDLRLEGAATDDTTEQFGIRAIAAQTVVYIHGIEFSGEDASHGLNSGIKNDSGTFWAITDCYFEKLQGIISGAGYGVLFGTACFNLVDACRFKGPGRHCVYFSVGTCYSIANGNTVDDFTDSAFALNSLDVHDANVGNTISNNVITGGGQGIVSIEAGAINVDGKTQLTRVIGNTIQGFVENGIVVHSTDATGGCFDNQLIGNTIKSVGRVGIFVIGATRTLISNNIIDEVSTETVDTHAGINVTSDSSFASLEAPVDTTIIGNVIRGSVMRASINLSADAPAPTGTVIINNRLGLGAVDYVDYNGVECVSAWNTYGVVDCEIGTGKSEDAVLTIHGTGTPFVVEITDGVGDNGVAVRLGKESSYPHYLGSPFGGSSYAGIGLLLRDNANQFTAIGGPYRVQTSPNNTKKTVAYTSKTDNIKTFFFTADPDMWSVGPGTQFTIGANTYTVKAAAEDRIRVVEDISGESSTGNLVDVLYAPIRFLIDTIGNFGINTTSFGTNSVGVVAVANGTAPASNPANIFQMYSLDIVAGNAAPHFRTEAGNLIRLYEETALTAADAGAINSGDAGTDTVIGNIRTRVGEIESRLSNIGFLP